MNRKNLMILLVAVAACLFVTACFSAPPASEVADIRAVLEENFQATTVEDLPRLMATISSRAPDRDKFAKESQDVFNRTDVYVRLDDFQMVGWKPPFAAARVVQTTLPKEENDRQEGNVYYATNSALLPEAETVEYTQVFLKERGKWKVHEITSAPRTIKPKAVIQDCPNGRCGVNSGATKGSPFR